MSNSTAQAYYPTLPNQWREERLVDIADLRTSNVDKKNHEGELPVSLCNYVDVYYNDKITADINFMAASASQSQIDKFNLRIGDVIITKDSESPNDIGIPALVTETAPDLVCGYHLTVIRADNENIIGPYLFYCLAARPAAHQFYLASNGVTRFGLTTSGTKNIRIALPSLPTQQKIADFLDRKTAQIDALIAKKRQLITKLKEKRLAVITQAVTRGLNPKAPLKDSGIEWLGEVPAHWEVVPLGFLVEFRGGMTPNTGTENYWDGDIPWVTPKDMKIDEISDSIGHVTEEAIKETGLSLIDPNAILVVVRGMILAHSFPTAINRAKVTINQDMKALRCEDRLNPEYLRYTLAGYEKTLSKMATESAHGTRKMETGTLKKFSIPVPPITEQIVIIDALRKGLSHLDKLSSKSESTITRLSEYRTALITAAVTGQLVIPQTPARRSSA